MTKSYIDLIQAQWENILNLYLQFEEKKPVMLYEVGKNQISAYPYEDFITELDKKSQQSLHQQYQRALENNQMVIFVKDDDMGQFVSYSLKIYEE